MSTSTAPLKHFFSLKPLCYYSLTTQTTHLPCEPWIWQKLNDYVIVMRAVSALTSMDYRFFSALVVMLTKKPICPSCSNWKKYIVQSKPRM